MEGDRTWPVRAFLLGSGLRIGELVALRWPNVDLEAGVVRVVEFVSTLGHDTVVSAGKSRDSVRSIDLDDGLVGVLRQQRKLQAAEQLAAVSWEDTDYVFTKPAGGAYHPQAAVTAAGDVLPRAEAASADRARVAPHERHLDVGQRRPGEGGRRTAWARRSDAVHKPLQPRNADDAEGRRERIGAALFGDIS
jgi:integrase